MPQHWGALNIELINTGSELMLGRVLNTHQQWLCRRLADLGYIVSRQVAIADTAQDILQSVRDALGHADLVITTGGLGPTSDDITRDLIAGLLGRELKEDAGVVGQIEKFFALRNRKMPERTRVQAMVPEGARVLANPNGTAPGLAIDLNPNPFRPGQTRSLLIMLPGPPRELRPMFDESVTPLLKGLLQPEPFACKTLRTSGIGESDLAAITEKSLAAFVVNGLGIAYCARVGSVDLRLTASGSGAESLVSEAAASVRPAVKQWVFGEDDDELQNVIVKLLTERNKTLATAESCTGGGIANLITNVPGASAIFLCGLVTYSNEAKQKLLGVSAKTLAEHGAVSEAVAAEMANGALRQSGADFSISVTGIAGPAGGTPEKPVGTVFMGIATPAGVKVEKRFNPYDRETFKQVTVQQALMLLRSALLKSH